MSYRIAVVDGKGGGLGRAICERLSNVEGVTLLALGTNSHATTNMLKNGAKDGATGENAICHMVDQVDLVIGPMAILVANAMMGEITPRMAQAIASCEAHKLLLPLQKCGISVIGVKSMSMKDMLDQLVSEVDRLMNN